MVVRDGRAETRSAMPVIYGGFPAASTPISADRTAFARISAASTDHRQSARLEHGQQKAARRTSIKRPMTGEQTEPSRRDVEIGGA